MDYSSGRLRIWLVVTLVFLGCLCPSLVVAESGQYISPLALAADSQGRNLYVAQHTASSVAVFNITDEKVTAVYSLPDRPTGLALSPDAKTLYVTGGSPVGRLHIVNTKTGKISKTITLGHTTVAPVLSPDGKTLYVCNRFNNEVAVIKLSGRKPKKVATIAVSRDPVAAAITPDGKSLLVANLIPAGAADKGYAAAVVSIIDTASRKVSAEITLPDGIFKGLR